MAEHLDVSLITIQELLENGREELKRKLAESHWLGIEVFKFIFIAYLGVCSR
jgi:hypothetical protein